MKFLLIIGFLLTTVNSYACSCGHIGILKNKKSADYVFKGQVKEIVETIIQDTIEQSNEAIKFTRTRYTFEILKSYKGVNDNKPIDLFSGMTDCAVRFVRNGTYLVYAYKDDKQLHYRLEDQKVEPYATTHNCSRTKRNTVLTFWESFVLWLT